jgi:hypothetical protein
MRTACCIALLAAMSACPAAAQTRDCQTIKGITVRQACLDRQAAEHRGQAQKGSSSMGDSLERMKREDDLLTKRLHSICKGC